MAKIDLKYFFQLKVHFRGGRPLAERPALIAGPALGRAQGRAWPGQSGPWLGQNMEIGLAKIWDQLHIFFSMKRCFILIFSMKRIFSY